TAHSSVNSRAWAKAKFQPITSPEKSTDSTWPASLRKASWSARAEDGTSCITHFFASSSSKHNEAEQLQKRNRSRRNAATSLPPRSGSPLHYPQGGVHSLVPCPFPFRALPLHPCPFPFSISRFAPSPLSLPLSKQFAHRIDRFAFQSARE